MLVIPPSAIQYTTDLFAQHDFTRSTVSSIKTSNQMKLVQRKSNGTGKLIVIDNLELITVEPLVSAYLKNRELKQS